MAGVRLPPSRAARCVEAKRIEAAEDRHRHTLRTAALVGCVDDDHLFEFRRAHDQPMAALTLSERR